MRDYAFACAAQSESLGGSLASLARNWLVRRRLARRSDGTDGDYPVEDIRWALSLPLSINPLVALEDRAFHRSRGLDQAGRAGAGRHEPPQACRPQL